MVLGSREAHSWAKAEHGKQSLIRLHAENKMPTHRFILLPERHGDYSHCTEYADSAAGVEIDDALVQYIWDTLQWLDTINPTKSPHHAGLGLNYHGLTVIDSAGAKKASRIFRLWADLMKEAPGQIELTGAYELMETDGGTQGAYATIVMDRSEVVARLCSIAEYADRAASGSLFLLHLGV